MKSLFFFNNQIYQNQRFQDTDVKFVQELSANQDFQDQAIFLWNLFQFDEEGRIRPKDFQQFCQNVLLLVAHQLTSELRCKLSEDDCLRFSNKKNLHFRSFAEYLAFICYQFVENVDLIGACGFLLLLYNRLLVLSVKNVETGEETDLKYEILVRFIERNKAESQLDSKQIQNIENPLIIIVLCAICQGFQYFEEIVIPDQTAIEAISANPNLCLIKKLQKHEFIVPLSCFAESVLAGYINNGFQIVKECRLGDVKNKRKNEVFQKIKITFDQASQGLIQKNVVLSIFSLNPVLQSCTTVESDEANATCYRMNQGLFVKIYFESLKSREGKLAYINTLSKFYTEEDYNIDRIDRLEKKWQIKNSQNQDKDLAKEKQNIQKILKQKNPNHEFEQFYFYLQQNIVDFQNEPNFTQNLQSLIQANSAPKLQEEFSERQSSVYQNNSSQEQSQNHQLENHIQFQKFVSKYETLPTDTIDTFNSDVLEYAQGRPLQILVVGKPKTGKTAFCKQLAKLLDIEHVESQKCIENIFEKIKKNEESPQTDEEGNPKEFLHSTERRVLNDLQAGKNIEHADLLVLLNLQMQSEEVANKGFVLDLPLEYSSSDTFDWVGAIISGKLFLPKLKCRYFSHLIELQAQDQDVLMFASEIMEKPEDARLYSQKEREDLRKPKVKNIVFPDEEEQEEPPPAEEEEGDLNKPVFEKDLVFRANENLEVLSQKLEEFPRLISRIQEFKSHLTRNEHIVIQQAGLSVEELVQVVQLKLQDEVLPCLRPLAIKLEAAGEKDLLTQVLPNQEDTKISRRWSQWLQIDPVELCLKNRIVQGKGEFACDYAGRVFLFDTEQNQTKFFENPRKYLQTAPKLPKTLNIAIIGPRKSGKNTVAQQLVEDYQLNLVDIEEIVGERLILQQQWEKHQPSNFDEKSVGVHLSEQEWKEFQKGCIFPSKEIWPIVFRKLGLPMQKKPEGWGIEKKEEEAEEMDEEKKKEEEKKKAEAAKKKQQQAKKEVKPEETQIIYGENGEILEERPITPPLEDIPLKEMIQLIQEDGKTLPVKGLCIIGQPVNEEQLNTLKYHNITLDKVIILMDKNEEEPGKVLASRPNFDQRAILEQELAIYNNAATFLKEALGEENVKEIDIAGSKQQVYNRIRLAIDPFQIRCDDETLVRVQADINEEEDDPLPWGEYGNFCPVTLADENWLMPGKAEFETMIRGRRHQCYGEKELNTLKEFTIKYVNPNTSRVSVPPPRIMLMGARGAGVASQLKRLYEMYQIPLFELKKNFLSLLENEREKRKNERIFARGFKPRTEEEEGAVDAEIMEENAEFDRRAHEIEMLKTMLSSQAELLINGNFFEVEETEVATPIVELLQESKKLPEALITLEVRETEFLKRKLNKKEIEDEYNAIMDKRRAEKMEKKRKEREEYEVAVKKAQEDGEQPPEPPNEEEEEDAEAPKLEEMLAEKTEKLKTQRAEQEAKCQEIAEALKTLGVQVIKIDSERSVSYVFEKICVFLNTFLEARENRLESFQGFKLKKPPPSDDPDQELARVDRIVYYEKSYTTKRSRYGDRNPLTKLNLQFSRKFPYIYRDRIYYFDNEQQLELVRKEPLKYLTSETAVPRDIYLKPIIFVIGAPKSGKSSLCKMFERKLSLVRIKLSHILDPEFLTNHLCLETRETLNLMKKGIVIPDELLVKLVIKRTQMQDCLANGWILDGFPQNLAQAQLFTQEGIIPNCVMSIDLSIFDVKARVLKELKSQSSQASSKGGPNKRKFGYNPKVLQLRLEQYFSQKQNLENYYHQNFNNLKLLNGKISKWGIFDQAKDITFSLQKSLQDFARSMVTKEPVLIHNLSLTQKEILWNLSALENFSPVIMKTQRRYVKNDLNSRYMIYFDKHIYVLDGESELVDFFAKPDLYVYEKLSFYNPSVFLIQREVLKHQNEVQFQHHCAHLLRENQVQNARKDLLVKYDNKIYSFQRFQGLLEFMNYPWDYITVKLPDKLPVNFNNTQNFGKKVAKKGDYTAFLQHFLGNIVMRVLAQLGYRRLKYPGLTCKETALKFIAISLKAYNQNKDAEYRQKYKTNLSLFLKHCGMAEEIKEESIRRCIFQILIQRKLGRQLEALR